MAGARPTISGCTAAGREVCAGLLGSLATVRIGLGAGAAVWAGSAVATGSGATGSIAGCAAACVSVVPGTGSPDGRVSSQEPPKPRARLAAAMIATLVLVNVMVCSGDWSGVP